LATLDEQVAGQVRAAEVLQLRIEELALAHNSAVLANRNGQPEAARHIATLDAAVSALRDSLDMHVAKFDDQLTVQARATDATQIHLDELTRAHNSMARASKTEAETEQRVARLDVVLGALQESFDERFVKLDEQFKAWAREADTIQLRLEELTQAHNSVARAARDVQPEIERRFASASAMVSAFQDSFDHRLTKLDEQAMGRLASVNAAVSALQDNFDQRLAKLDEQAEQHLASVNMAVSALQVEVTQEREQACGLREFILQLEKRVDAWSTQMEVHCASMQMDVERADSKCWQESRKRLDTEHLLLSLLGEINGIREEFDRRGPDSPAIVAHGNGTTSAHSPAPELRAVTDTVQPRGAQGWPFVGPAAYDGSMARQVSQLDRVIGLSVSAQRPAHLFTSSTHSRGC